MDILDGFEIYIPKKAEVKTIPLWSLSNSMLKWMGLPQSDCDGSRNLAASPEGIWISPAVIRKRGHPSANHTGDSAKESVSLLLSRKLRTAQVPFQMSFISSNHTAYRVLGDTLPGRKAVSAQTSQYSMLSHCSLPHTHQDAIVIYRGRVYLSIKRTKRVRSQGETHEPNPVAQSLLSDSLLPATSASTSESQKELLNDYYRSKKKLATCKDGVTHSENEDEFMNKERDASSSKAAHSVPQSSDGIHKVDSLCHETSGKDPGGKQAIEEDARKPTWFQQEGEEEEVVVNKVIPTGSGESEMEDLRCQEAASADQNDVDSNLQVSSDEVDDAIAVTEDSNIQSSTRGALLGLAFTSTPVPQDFDFEQLAQEELISQIRAKLREREAALNNLQS
ncbi:uncharacterized protein LOC139913100 isoform X2 [Centroberyx gerrardi]|uniref:uncharacterized protein isoform X2 n=1 Tax=Centroberyx gerrardi TaxID=166262 RepID=UPI003AAB93BF